MKPIYDAALRDAVRLRMSPPNGESVSAIARDTGIAVPTLYSWRSQWQKQGLLVPATSRPPEQWNAADKLAAVIQSTGLSGAGVPASGVNPPAPPPRRSRGGPHTSVGWSHG